MKAENERNGIDAPTGNIAVDEIDSETAQKLRGDAIGDTLYSQTFVLKTLMKLEDLKWCDELEDDLCFLWDMTLEKDVCDYLYQVDFPVITCEALEKYDAPEYSRFLEIIIGTLANMMCVKTERYLCEEHIQIVLEHIKTNDSCILIQVLRVLSTVTYYYKDLSFIDLSVFKMLSYILENSTNKELLFRTLEALDKLTTDCLLNKECLNGNLVRWAIKTADILTHDETEDKNFEVYSHNQQNCIKFVLEFICNYCVYVREYPDAELVQEIMESSYVIVSFIDELLLFFTRKENLLSITHMTTFYFESFNYILSIILTSYNSQLLIHSLKIVNILLDNALDDINEFIELFCYLLSLGEEEKLLMDLKDFKLEFDKIKAHIMECEIKFNFDYKDKLCNLLVK